MIKTKKKDRVIRRKAKIRKKIFGTAQRPRITIYKSNLSLYIQFIDDEKGHTLCGGAVLKKNNKEGAKDLVKEVLPKVKGLKIVGAVFDRNGYKYHGVIEEIASELRKGGLKF